MRHPLHDRIHNATLRQVRDSAVRVVDAIQVQKPEEQIAGLAVTFLMLCERYGYPPRRALEAAENMMMQARYRDATHFEGLKLYMQHELPE